MRHPQHAHTPLREEAPNDAPAVAMLIDAAFAGHPHSDGREATIVARLRAAGALSLSLVAEVDQTIVGHVAFSPVTIDGEDRGWLGLGPVSIHPGVQNAGLGSRLIRGGLARLIQGRAAGCVVLGDPAYYRRFGFGANTDLRYDDAPSAYFLSLILAGPPTSGTVTYHPAFTDDR